MPKLTGHAFVSAGHWNSASNAPGFALIPMDMLTIPEHHSQNRTMYKLCCKKLIILATGYRQAKMETENPIIEVTVIIHPVTQSCSMHTSCKLLDGRHGLMLPTTQLQGRAFKRIYKRIMLDSCTGFFTAARSFLEVCLATCSLHLFLLLIKWTLYYKVPLHLPLAL